MSKRYYRYFLSNMSSAIKGGMGWNIKESGMVQFLVGNNIQRKEIQNFGHECGVPLVSPLVGKLESPIRNTRRNVLGLLTVMIRKRVEESIFFQSDKFIAWKVKDVEEVEKPLLVLNLCKIIHPFQSKKCLRTKWNLNWNPQKCLIGY